MVKRRLAEPELPAQGGPTRPPTSAELPSVARVLEELMNGPPRPVFFGPRERDTRAAIGLELLAMLTDSLPDGADKASEYMAAASRIRVSALEPCFQKYASRPSYYREVAARFVLASFRTPRP